jgi:hypothetical protein
MFMLTNFDNRIKREVINELFVQYGEALIPNSFEMYCDFLSDQNENDERHLRARLIEERNKADEEDKELKTGKLEI